MTPAGATDIACSSFPARGPISQEFAGRLGRPFRFSADRRCGQTAQEVCIFPTDVLNPLSEKSIFLPFFRTRLQALSARLAEFGWRVKRLEAMVGSRFRTDRNLLNGHSRSDCLRRT